jgi:hypothetical protein
MAVMHNDGRLVAGKPQACNQGARNPPSAKEHGEVQAMPIYKFEGM